MSQVQYPADATDRVIVDLQKVAEGSSGLQSQGHAWCSRWRVNWVTLGETPRSGGTKGVGRFAIISPFIFGYEPMHQWMKTLSRDHTAPASTAMHMSI
jgi:hypothetical protein